MDCGIPSIITPWIKIETKTVSMSDEIKKALRKTKSVKHETKTLMLKEIIENYRVENPNKQAIGFQEVRKILQEKYGVSHNIQWPPQGTGPQMRQMPLFEGMYANIEGASAG